MVIGSELRCVVRLVSYIMCIWWSSALLIVSNSTNVSHKLHCFKPRWNITAGLINSQLRPSNTTDYIALFTSPSRCIKVQCSIIIQSWLDSSLLNSCEQCLPIQPPFECSIGERWVQLSKPWRIFLLVKFPSHQYRGKTRLDVANCRG